MYFFSVQSSDGDAGHAPGRFELKDVLLDFLAFCRHTRFLSNVSPSPTIPRLEALILVCKTSPKEVLNHVMLHQLAIVFIKL